MDIKIIRKNEKLEDVLLGGNKILEVALPSMGNESFYDISLYDPAQNSILSIAPEIKKYNFIPVYNCIWNSADVYFASYEEGAEHEITISLYRFNETAAETEEILKFTEKSIIVRGYKCIKLFVLTETQILVQTEHKKDWESKSLMGNIEFVQTIFDLNSSTSSQVNDLNFINNGINMIYPVSKTGIMLKTGYSYLEDERISGESENDALIESVYFGSMALLLSALSKESATVGFKMLATTYFDKCILSPRVDEDYIYFSIADSANKTVETIFFNHKTEETFRCLTENTDPSDAGSGYVAGNVPYVKNYIEGRTEFLNLRTSDVDCVFYDDNLEAVNGRLIIFSKKKKNKDFIRVYRYPKLDLLLEEEGSFNSLCRDDDHYYIYISENNND